MQKSVPVERASTGSRVSSTEFDALIKVLGRHRAEVLDFYVDSRLASEIPREYDRCVRGLLGDHGGGLVVEALNSELARALRPDAGRGRAFSA